MPGIGENVVAVLRDPLLLPSADLLLPPHNARVSTRRGHDLRALHPSRDTKPKLYRVARAHFAARAAARAGCLPVSTAPGNSAGHSQVPPKTPSWLVPTSTASNTHFPDGSACHAVP